MPSKRQQQAGYLLPNPIRPYDLLCVELKIPNAPEYREAFLGQIWQLSKWYTWHKTYLPDDTTASQAAEYWREILTEHLCIQYEDGMCCCQEKQITDSYYDEFWLKQVSTDNGESYTPEYDERFNSPTFPPVISGGGDTCNASLAAKEAVKQIVDAILDGIDTGKSLTEIVEILTAILILWFPITAGIATIITWILNLVLKLGETFISDAMDTDTYDEFVCALEAYVNEEGQWSQDDFFALSQNLDNYILDPNAIIVLRFILGMMGSVGLTNAAQTTTPSGECDCGGAWCYTFNFAASDGGWLPGENNVGTDLAAYAEATGWVFQDVRVPSTGSAFRLIRMSREFTATLITRVLVTYDYTWGFTSVDPYAGNVIYDSAGVMQSQNIPQASGTGKTLEWNGGRLTDDINVQLVSSLDTAAPYTYGGDITITSIRIEGEGENPFGADNC